MAPGAQNVPPPGHDHKVNRNKLACKHAQDITFPTRLCQEAGPDLYRSIQIVWFYARFRVRLVIKAINNGSTIATRIVPTR